MYSKVLFNILATLSGIYSGIYYDILSGTHSGILSSIYYPDVLFAILLASILTFYLAFFAASILTLSGAIECLCLPRQSSLCRLWVRACREACDRSRVRTNCRGVCLIFWSEITPLDPGPLVSTMTTSWRKEKGRGRNKKGKKGRVTPLSLRSRDLHLAGREQRKMVSWTGEFALFSFTLQVSVRCRLSSCFCVLVGIQLHLFFWLAVSTWLTARIGKSL